MSKKIINKYNHLMKKVYYPAENGYRWEMKPLPDWVNITVTQDKDNKYLTVHSRIHINKAVEMSPKYSLEFTDSEIIKDLSSSIIRDFGI